MRDGRASLWLALTGALGLALCAVQATAVRAQDWSGSTEGSTTSGPTVEDYLKEAGPDTKLVNQGALKIDGRPVNCGKRPTVLNSNFDSWGGAFPGFVILNTKKIAGLSTPVKLYVYSHECGHQFEGPDETKADLFAIRRGVTRGWLDAVGMEDICTFISTLKGDGVHPPGPERCETMRKYYRELVVTESQKTTSTSAPQPQTLGPAQ
ncbi:MAG TPA: hypothetical protein DD732_04435 [Rhizobiales bacterium]|jgi:hypothetical protein|nr:hypothetical protein [Hyphomicrobiales bacterium]HBR26272.1 hypothetical protein [Hyphomicrobiales bacterium]